MVSKQNYDVDGDQHPPAEARQKLLCDARSVRDVYAQNLTTAENLLEAAQQTVIALTTQVRIANERLETIEDFIGDVRTRLYMRGIESFPAFQRKRQASTPSPSINLDAYHPPYVSST
jgi:hypothetical protein